MVHHLVVDGVSWRILLEDLSLLYKGYAENKNPQLPLKTDAFIQWGNAVQTYAESNELNKQYNYWQHIVAHNSDLFEIPNAIINTDKGTHKSKAFILDTQTTELLQTKCHSIYNTEINDILLAALSLGIDNTFQKQKVLIDLEGHGREQVIENMDITRTIGWFTSKYPVLLDISQANGDTVNALVLTKENLRKIPNKGVGYGILKYLGNGFENQTDTSIVFNYLGDFGSVAGSQNNTEKALFTYSNQYKGKSSAKENDVLGTKLNVSGILVMGQLQMSISYNDHVFDTQTMELLIKNYQTSLNDLIETLSKQTKTFLTPSDLTYKNIPIEQLSILNKENNIQDIYRLSPLQEGIYYHWYADDDKATYFRRKSFRLNIPNVTVDNIKNSYELLIQRHDILRTEFSSEYTSDLVQIVRKHLDSSFTYIDLTTKGLSQKQILKYVEEYKKEDRELGFQLNSRSQIRLSLINLGNNTYEFIWSNHHIIMDGWCISILINEFYQILTTLNNNQKVTLPKVTPYVNYIKWLDTIDKSKTLNYWKEYLADYNQKAIIPFKTKSNATYRPAREKIELKGGFLHKIRTLAKANKITENNIIQCAWGYLLSKYNNTNDVVFGTVVSGRPPQIKGVENMVGLFINTIPVRVKYPDKCTVSQLLQSQQEKSIQSLEHHYVGLSEVQAQSELGPNLIDHILVFENYAVQEKSEIQKTQENQQSQIAILQTDNFENIHYDFDILVNPSQSKLKITFRYNENVYGQKEIQHIAQHFQKILEAFIADSNPLLQDIEYLSHEQREELLHIFNDTKTDYPKDKAIIELFEEQVTKTPENIALVFEKHELSYQELNQIANQMADYLKQSSAPKPDELIAIQLDRSQWMIVAILAVLKTGAAYLPIDPQYPQERIQYMIQDSQAKATINQEFLDTFINQQEQYSKNNTPNKVNANNLAYVIYTSGSTGKPKGVMIENKSVLRLVLGINYVDLSSTRTLLSTGSFSFDATTFEYWSALLYGGKLIIPRTETLLDVHLFEHNIKLNKVDIAWFTSGLLNHLVEANINIFKSLKTILVGGDKLSYQHIKKLKNLYPELKLINGYGPTESTTFALTYTINNLVRDIPIGIPISNTQVYILDSNHNLLPKGVIGEICISGDGLARGYLNRPELTQEKFIPHPFIKGQKLYKTGDLGKLLLDGNIEFGGRKDYQVKIRGYRIELGEIENAILELDKIGQCAVLAKEDKGHNEYLVAYYTCEEAFDKETIKLNLAQSLPDYMLPQYFVNLEQLPLTPNGKIDKKALPDPQTIERLGTTQYVAPRNKIERQLITVWQEVLNKEKIGIRDDFFKLGGHSLLVIEVLARINKILDSEVEINTLFEYPTILELAEKIVTSSPTKGKILFPIQEKGTQRALYFAPPGGGTTNCYIHLAKQLGESQPLYAFQSPGIYGELPIAESVEKMASIFIKEMQKVNSTGPYRLGGYSFGGIVAYEMALQLEKMGFKVDELIIFDISISKIKNRLKIDINPDQVFTELIYSALNQLLGKEFDTSTIELKDKARQEQIEVLCESIRSSNFYVDEAQVKGRLKVRLLSEICKYKVREEKLDARVIYFQAMYDDNYELTYNEEEAKKHIKTNLDNHEWNLHTKNEVIIHRIPCTHATMLNSEYLEQVSKLLLEENC